MTSFINNYYAESLADHYNFDLCEENGFVNEVFRTIERYGDIDFDDVETIIEAVSEMDTDETNMELEEDVSIFFDPDYFFGVDA